MIFSITPLKFRKIENFPKFAQNAPFFLKTSETL
jgi:hypothetical protein